MWWLIPIGILIELQIYFIWRNMNTKHKLVQQWLREVWQEIARL